MCSEKDLRLIVIDRYALIFDIFSFIDYISANCDTIPNIYTMSTQFLNIWSQLNSNNCFSIAGMVRTEYDSSSSQDMALRTSLLFRVAKELKWLSDVHKICVVVINQVHIESVRHFFFFLNPKCG